MHGSFQATDQMQTNKIQNYNKFTKNKILRPLTFCKIILNYINSVSNLVFYKPQLRTTYSSLTIIYLFANYL